MERGRPTVAFRLTLATGAIFLLDALVASSYLEPCTSTGPVAAGPCDASMSIVTSLLALAVGMIVVAFLFLAYVRFSRLWGVVVIAASTGSYILLMILVFLSSFAPEIGAVFTFGLLFLPGFVLGVVSGRAGF